MNITKEKKGNNPLKKQTRLLLAAAIVLGSGLSTVKAQVGVGTITPNANAVLDMTATNKGFLPPRVALTAKNSVSPLSAFVSGMIVYNTATAGTAPNRVTPGLYYSNGSKWVRVVIGRNDQTVDVGNIAGNLPTPNPFTGATFTPNVPASADKIYIDTTDGSTWTYNGATYDSYVEDPSTPFYYANGTNDAGSNKTSAIYRTGNIGIGTATPHAPLQFSNGLVNRKIVLYEGANNDHEFYGLGMGSSALRYQVQYPGNHIFYASASASASTELMRITSLGRIGIHNVANPFNELEVNGTLAVGAAYVGNVLAPANGAIIQGNVGLGTTTANAPLQFASTLANRKIVMYEIANNDNQFYGLGISSGALRYQVATGGAHAFYSGVDATSSNELVRITGAGNVGIGTNVPGVKLQISDTVSGTADPSLLITNNNGGPALLRLTSGSGYNAILGQNTNVLNGTLLPNASYWGAPGGGHDFQIITSGLPAPSTVALTVLNNGNIGIGMNAPHGLLQFPTSVNSRKIVLYEVSNDDHNFYGFGVNSSVLRYQVAGGSSHVFYAATSATTSDELFRITANGDILPGVDNGGNCGIPSKRWTAVYAINGTIQTSDRNLKTNIKDINYGLKDIMKLRPVTYNWKTDPNNNHMVGLIAQEVEKVIPEAVVAPKEKGDYYGMKYNELVPVLIKGMQEQQAKIETLTIQNTKLTAQVAEIAELKTAMAEMRSELSRVVVRKVAGNNTAKR